MTSKEPSPAGAWIAVSGLVVFLFLGLGGGALFDEIVYAALAMFFSLGAIVIGVLVWVISAIARR